MELVVDTNVVFSAMIADGVTRELLLDDRLSFHVPEFFFSEFTQHLEEIQLKTGLDESDLKLLVSLLFEDVHVVPRDEFTEHIPEAKEAIGSVDPDDVPFLALAIHLDAGIWSDDDHFQRQGQVPTWRNAEIARRFRPD